MRIQDDAFDLVLFDLDGTLVDTAPDMVAILQAMQRDHGQQPVAYELGRSNVSNGAMGLLRIGFPDADEEQRIDLVAEYLDRYAERLCRKPPSLRVSMTCSTDSTRLAARGASSRISRNTSRIRYSSS